MWEKLSFSNLNQNNKVKINGISKVRPIAWDCIGIDSILFDRAVPEIFYFKHDWKKE